MRMNSRRLLVCLITLVLISESSCLPGWNPQIDVAILLDTAVCVDETVFDSNGTNVNEWQKVMDFCASLPKEFGNIGYDGTLLGLITFSGDASIDLHWKDCHNSTSYEEAVEKLRSRSDDDAPSIADPATGLILYDKELIGGNVKKANYIVMILRGCITKAVVDAVKETRAENVDKLILIDLRPKADKDVLEFNPFGSDYHDLRVNHLYSNLNDQVARQIRIMECQYQVTKKTPCYYDDDSMKMCRSHNLTHRPAERYGKCDGPPDQQRPIRCPLKQCEETCDNERPWEKCKPYECEQNVTVNRAKFLKESHHEKLQNCRESKFIECPSCNVTPLPAHVVKMMFGITFGIFATSLLVVTIMLIYQFTQKPESKKTEGKSQETKSAIQFIIEKPTMCD